MLRVFKKLIAVGVIFSGVATIGYQSVYAKEFEISEPDRSDVIINSGEVNALVVRLGYKDFPTDESNEYYISDQTVKALFDDHTIHYSEYYYGSLSDYLNKSSYGSLSLKLGDIVDIQMSGDAAAYWNNDYDDHKDSKSIIESKEFIRELYSKINVLDYDNNGDNRIDALYIIECSENVDKHYWGYVAHTDDIEGYTFLKFFQPRNIFGGVSQSEMEGVIIHETGHLLFGLPDYYSFTDYTKTDDIGGIMGYGVGDYDAISKYKIGWLNKDNIISIEPDDGETGVVELTPYDSDTAEGKKIAVFKCGEYYIAVDYCDGINNNDYLELWYERAMGFRFYLVDENLQPSEVYINETKDGVTHQLFTVNEELEDVFGKGLTITNIEPSKPSFTYSYVKPSETIEIYPGINVDDWSEDDKKDDATEPTDFEKFPGPIDDGYSPSSGDTTDDGNKPDEESTTPSVPVDDGDKPAEEPNEPTSPVDDGKNPEEEPTAPATPVDDGKNPEEEPTQPTPSDPVGDDQWSSPAQPADYSRVEEAKSHIPSDADLAAYTDESVDALRAAIAAVVEGKKADEQATVDDYAKAIEEAIAGLVKKSEDPSSSVDQGTASNDGRVTSSDAGTKSADNSVAAGIARSNSGTTNSAGTATNAAPATANTAQVVSSAAGAATAANTGDKNHSLGWILTAGAAAVAGVAATVVRRKKKQ